MNISIRPVGLTHAASTSTGVVAYDGTSGQDVKLTPQQVAGSTDATLKQTIANAEAVTAFMKDTFGRNGWDAKGAVLPIVVHALEPGMGNKMNNAYWDGQMGKMFIGDGDGKMFTPLGLSKDIIAHELGHAMLETEVKMGFNGQEGALHEHFGDVMGALVDPDDWQIGEDSFTPGKPGDALRDMSKPTRYQHMNDVRGGTGEPHDLADIPNLAAVRVAEKIGRTEMGKVWYNAFTEQLQDHAKFQDAATATVKAAELLYGASSSQVAAVTDAWQSVGVLTKVAPTPAAFR